MSRTSFDAIVVGVGGIGSAAAADLARRGLKVLGIDRFHPPHAYGSSHGSTRLIRKAYFEDPRYLPLLRRAYAGWETLAERTGERLYTPQGFLVLSAPAAGGADRSARMLEVAAAHGVPLEVLSAPEVRRRFPPFALPDDWSAQFEPEAGYLAVERCIEVQIAEATKAGAEWRFGERVRGWQSTGDRVVVETDRDRYEAGALVLAPGAWSSELLGDLDWPLVVRRGLQFWFPGEARHRGVAGMPCFAFSRGEEFIYGFPDLGAGLKVASYAPGDVLADPLVRDPAYTAEELGPVAGAIARHLPGVETQPARWSICMYTLTPDENFLLDRHPAHRNVFYFAGDSGHAFKFAPALGEVLGTWVCGETPKAEVAFLANRDFVMA